MRGTGFVQKTANKTGYALISIFGSFQRIIIFTYDFSMLYDVIKNREGKRFLGNSKSGSEYLSLHKLGYRKAIFFYPLSDFCNNFCDIRERRG